VGEITFPNAVQGSGGGVFGYLVLRRQSGGAHYRVGVFVNSAGKVFIRGQDDTGTQLFPDFDTGLSFSPGNTFHLRVQAEGGSPTTIRAKAWKAGTSEPGTWQVTKTGITSGPATAGSLGIRTISTTNTSSTLEFDNLRATQLPAP
jgi:hypothetical protein